MRVRSNSPLRILRPADYLQAFKFGESTNLKYYYHQLICTYGNHFSNYTTMLTKQHVVAQLKASTARSRIIPIVV